MYSSVEKIEMCDDPVKKISKIMISGPKFGLDTMLDRSGVELSTEVVEEVLKRFENAGMLAYQFFEWAGKKRNYSHSVIAYHTMIESLAKIRQYKIMWNLVNAMRSKGMLNIETFCIIMRKYARAHKVDEAIYAFNVMEKYGLTPNLAAFNGLLGALCKAKNVRKAQEIFDQMKGRFEPDTKTFSILLEGWGRAPNLLRARAIFKEMADGACPLDIVTYSIMVDILCKTGRVDEAVGIVRSMNARGYRPTSFIYTILVHTYGDENRIEDAIDTFQVMINSGVLADVVVYNALISAFCKANKLQNAYRVVKEMKTKGVMPNARTCNIILNTWMGLQQYEEAFRFFRSMIRICDPDADTYTMMIKMFLKMDDLEKAMKIWKYMRSKRFVPSLHTYSVLINGFCEKKNASEACVFMEEMIEKGIRPPASTFGKLRQLLIKEDRHDVLEFLQQKMNFLIEEPLGD